MKKYEIKDLKNYLKLGILCMIIVIPGIVGWIVEVLFTYFKSGMTDLRFKGGNFLPWINMYPIGALLILLVTYKFRNNPIKVLLVSVICAGLFEFLTGFVFDYFFGIRYWDYEGELLNINGYVCLISLTLFGIGGLFLIYIVMPILIKISEVMPKNIFLILTIGLCSIIILDEIYNLFIAKIFSLPDAIKLYKGIR